ncbi:unnamed protein product [Cylindrotheca closterium]|uniref:Phosphodiesterase n=1 Tax=Cylindrotheca closterium TaxID=2856 RepID=A0AAD2CKQ6_9STRA|nr:unnamed protein product [Cylindrotheca closterium]
MAGPGLSRTPSKRVLASEAESTTDNVRFRVESSYVDDDTANNRSTEMGMSGSEEQSRENSRSQEYSKSLEFTTASSEHFGFSRSHKRSSSYSGASKWRQESQWVQRSKYSVLAFLAVTCIGSATGMYFLTKASETAGFAEEVEDHANELVAISHQEATNIFEAISNFAVMITSYAIDTQTEFPFVTIPHFEHRGNNLRSITGAGSLTWNAFVELQDVDAWVNYTRQQDGWIQDGLNSQAKRDGTEPLVADEIPSNVYRLGRDPESGAIGTFSDTDSATKLVTWQVSPVPQNPDMVNLNLFSTPFANGIENIDGLNVLSKFMRDPRYLELDEETNLARPQSLLAQPVYKDFRDADNRDSSIIVGYLVALLPWDNFFKNIIPETHHTMDLVLSNDCGEVATLQVRGPDVVVVSNTEDTHDPEFDSMVVRHTFGQIPAKWATFDNKDRRRLQDEVQSINSYWCTYDLAIYPTEDFRAQSEDDETIFYPVGIVIIFVFTTAVFLLHDTFIARRQARIEESAARSNAIVQSLFPAQVRERLLMAGNEDKASQQITRNEEKTANSSDHAESASKNDGIGLEDGDLVTDRLLRTKPIADLFPHATVMFADICGFTAWSSVREPTQVFTLLEQIYNSFDILARKRRVFKVETIGDCYVAAAGLPDPRPDHAVAMCRFANECLIKMHSVVKKLEVRLGPDTAELGMRFGLHSGPVTAGVLRGEKSRFQLFGDTVNTASRIETTGERNRVHLSEDTARILIQSGKESWVERRDGVVAAKGKGDMVTYWLTLAQSKLKKRKANKKEATIAEEENAKPTSNSTSIGEKPASLEIPERSISLDQHITYDDRKQRLIDWNVDVLTTFLKKIQAMRAEEETDALAGKNFEHDSWRNAHADTTVLDEVREIIALPQKEQVYKRDPQSLQIGEKATAELKEYVGLIASMYHENSFHNFEHASHVTQSVTKLLTRIVTADDIDYNDYQYKKKGKEADLHQHTYGITSDPITQFACAFSALIHDVDHSGVPNAQLIKEESDVALFYKNKSVAEQNSVDLAWSLLMEPEFDALRACIYRDKDELDRFRQLVVNSVMATDIADRELGAARKARWVKAFAHSDEETEETSSALREGRIDAVNRKATIVIEHLIQASDVSHTMQHWHVYSKWNEKLFHEMYGAYKSGRAGKDPTEFWYTGELGFFDFYIIPLAKKLKECGVFGVASDEYLNYAVTNREEWERKGLDMIEKYKAAHGKTAI